MCSFLPFAQVLSHSAYCATYHTIEDKNRDLVHFPFQFALPVRGAP